MVLTIGWHGVVCYGVSARCVAAIQGLFTASSLTGSGEGAPSLVTKVFMCDPCLGQYVKRASRGRFQSMLQSDGRRRVGGGRWEVGLTICP
jgi:3-oxoacyl-[acyl-carrier-protein] synthase III